jgi:hypothetical protein
VGAPFAAGAETTAEEAALVSTTADALRSCLPQCLLLVRENPIKWIYHTLQHSGLAMKSTFGMARGKYIEWEFCRTEHLII